jgi:hypothetical protein
MAAKPLNCMKTLRQGTVGISPGPGLPDLAPVLDTAA